jgi:hypothetical protein
MDPMGYWNVIKAMFQKKHQLSAQWLQKRRRQDSVLSKSTGLWVWKGRTVVAPKSNGYQWISIIENMGYLYHFQWISIIEKY